MSSWTPTAGCRGDSRAGLEKAGVPVIVLFIDVIVAIPVCAAARAIVQAVSVAPAVHPCDMVAQQGEAPRGGVA
jgi:hypothetical protein